MSTTIPQYPFDPTGLAETNKVIEVMAVKSKGMFDHYYVVPRVAPFYAESVKLKLYPVGSNPNNPAQGQELTEGIHYNFGYHFTHASHTIGKPVYGAISLYDRSMEGQLRIEYQTLGGDWVLDDQTMSELMLNRAYNPRIATWEQVVELPLMFPIVDHDFNIDDFVGMSDVVEELDEIEKAILYANEGGLQNHAEDISNPHRVTKTQVGLGLVDNFPTAAIGEATGGTANNRFMTPLRTKQLIDAHAIAALNLHANNVTNPHQVTKAQVGLGNVQNLALASEAEAEAGASNARYMTPLRVREAIEAIAGTKLDAHIGNMSNPHQVTKSQVGLGNVPNIGIAADNDALAGLNDQGMITPRLLSMVLRETVGAGLTDHIQDSSNPHGVTKAQVGLGDVINYGIATEAEARDAIASNKYMTPLAVRQAINELVGESSDAHVSDHGNPHQVTKTQVGLGNVPNIGIASDNVALQGTGDNGIITPRLLSMVIAETIGVALASHAQDVSNPHQVTKAQVGLGLVPNMGVADLQVALAGLVDDGIITPRVLAYVLSETVGADLASHLSDSNNPHYVTKAQVGLGSVQNFPIATEVEARDGTAPDRYMTPLAVRHAIQSMAGESSGLHFTDYSNPHQVTANQVGAYTKVEVDNFLAGKLGTGQAAADAEMVFGMNAQGLENWMGQRTAGEALKFGGFTYPEAKGDILSGKVADSSLLDGKTYSELRTDIVNAVEGGSSTHVIPHMSFIEDDLGDEVEPPEHWIRVGHITFTLPDENNPHADMTSNVTLLITGGRNDETHGDSLQFTSVLEVGAVWDSEGDQGENYMMVRGARLKHLTKPVDTDYTIGYKAVGDRYDAILEFYLKFTGVRTPIILTELTGGQWIPETNYPSWNDISDLVTVEPTNLEYPTVVSDWTQEIVDLQAFSQRIDNPHKVTKAQTGLGSVQNYGLATKVEAEAGTSNAKYMTPLRTKEAIDKIAGAALTTHNNDKANPHAVTKAQVGLGSVQNYDVATKAEAEAGVISNKYMTPLRTKEAIDKIAGTALTAHSNDKTNPHGVTKSQVGLGSVQNYQMATDVEAVAGTATNRYMSPKSSAALVDQRVDEMIQSLIEVMNEALDELNNL